MGGLALTFELGKEAIDRTSCSLIILKRFADDPARQGGGQGTDFGTHLGHHRRSFRLELGFSLCPNPRDLRVGLLTQIRKDLGALTLRLLSDSRRFGAGLRERRGVAVAVAGEAR